MTLHWNNFLYSLVYLMTRRESGLHFAVTHTTYCSSSTEGRLSRMEHLELSECNVLWCFQCTSYHTLAKCHYIKHHLVVGVWSDKLTRAIHLLLYWKCISMCMCLASRAVNHLMQTLTCSHNLLIRALTFQAFLAGICSVSATGPDYL